MTHSVKEHNVEGLAGNLMFERMGRMWANLESSSEIYRVDVSWIPYGGIRVSLQRMRAQGVHKQGKGVRQAG